MPLKVSKENMAAYKGLLSKLHFLFSYPWGNTYHGFPYLLNVDEKQTFFFHTLSLSDCMETFLLKFGLSLD